MRKLLILLLLAVSVALQGQIRSGVIAATAGGGGFTARSSDYQTVYNAYPTKPSAANARIDDDFYYSLDSLFTAESITLHYLLVPAVQYQDGALINWANPGTYNGDEAATGITWTTLEGYTGADGDYISTNWNPNGILAQDNATIGIYLRINQQQASGYVYGCGAADLTDNIFLSPRNTSDGLQAKLNATLYEQDTQETSDGFFMNTRRGATDIEMYVDGSSTDAESDASTAVPNAEMFLLKHTNDATTYYSTNQFSIFMICTKVTTAQAGNIYTIVQRRMTRLGKQV